MTKSRKIFQKNHFSKTDDNLVTLYRNVLANYDRDIRPSIRHDLPVNVTFTFSLSHIIDVDERNQILTTNAWVHQTWRDFNLVWDPRKYDGITKVHVPFDLIWLPDVILYNNAASEYAKSVMSTDVIVSYDGNISWTLAGIFKSSCGLDVRYYPFDFQNCVLKFASWAYDGTKIDILLASEKGDQSSYMDSTEWHLHLIRAERDSIVYSCCPEPYPFVDIQITIQRRPMFFVFNLILPCVLISIIALLGFYMPSDSGEKVTLGITALLSTTVFLMLVAEGMPPTSEALPLIGIYYGVTIFIVSLATGMTVFTLNVHHHGRQADPLPQLVQNLVFNYLSKMLFLKVEPYHSINDHVEYFYRLNSESGMVSRNSAAAINDPFGIGTGRADPYLRYQLRVMTPTRRALSEISHSAFNHDASSLNRTSPYRTSPDQLRRPFSHRRPYSQQHHRSPSEYRHPSNIRKTPPSGGSLSIKSKTTLKRVSFSDDSISSLSLPPNGIGSIPMKSFQSIPTQKSKPGDAQSETCDPGVKERRAPLCSGESGDEATLEPSVNHVTPAHVPPASSISNQLNLPNSSTSINRIQSTSACAIAGTSPACDTNQASSSSGIFALNDVSSLACSLDTFESEFLRVLAKVHATIERNEMRLAEKDRRNAMKLEWQQVAMVLDRFFFYLFFVITVVSSLAIIYQRQWIFE
ncbi:neurotransmitter-gated ion-channel ligand binding domain-containing protein [Ditylenchus destructor]|nr:neurotransmitter-gated ion-channel ligand binding domain-containing protein [Ditylenchus destructor]